MAVTFKLYNTAKVSKVEERELTAHSIYLYADQDEEAKRLAEEYSKMTQAEAIAKAEANNLSVFVPDEHTITLDLDKEENEKQLKEILPLAEKLFDLKLKDTWSSKSGHRHAVFTTPLELTPERRIILQACLGSDPKRELFGLRNTLLGEKTPSLLFRPNF